MSRRVEAAVEGSQGGQGEEEELVGGGVRVVRFGFAGGFEERGGAGRLARVLGVGTLEVLEETGEFGGGLGRFLAGQEMVVEGFWEGDSSLGVVRGRTGPGGPGRPCHGLVDVVSGHRS